MAILYFILEEVVGTREVGVMRLFCYVTKGKVWLKCYNMWQDGGEKKVEVNFK